MARRHVAFVVSCARPASVQVRRMRAAGVAMTSLVCRKGVDNGLKTVENPVKNVFRRGEGAARRSGAKAGARVFLPPKTVFEAFFYRKQCPVRRNFINFAFIYIVSIKPASH